MKEVEQNSRQVDAAVMTFIALGKELFRKECRPNVDYVPAHRFKGDCS